LGKAFYALLYAALTIAFIPAFVAIGARYEGRLFPVVAKLEIISIEKVDGDQSSVFVKFNKLRDCKYLGISWYNKSGETLRRVAVNLNPEQGSDSTRPVGQHISGPWTVDIPPEHIRKRSYVVLTHQCHPLYITTTIIYP
jgi:hypothetical protein